MYVYKYFCSSPSTRQSYNSVPDEPLFMCVFFLSRQNTWNKASFQNLLIPSSHDFVPSFLAYNFYSCGKYEEHNHKTKYHCCHCPRGFMIIFFNNWIYKYKVYSYVQENSVRRRWQTQGPWAESGPPPCFICLAPCFYPTTAASSLPLVKE